MTKNRLGTMVYALIASVFAVTALVLVRAQRVETSDAVPLVNPTDAAEVYHQRLQATRKLLQDNRLDL